MKKTAKRSAANDVTNFVAANVKMYVCFVCVSTFALGVVSALHTELCAFRWDVRWLATSGSPTCRWLSYSNYVLHTVVDSSFVRVFTLK